MFKRHSPDPVPEKVTKPRRISQHRMNRLVQVTRSQIRRVTDRLIRGKITPEEWGERMHAILEERHTRAVVLGRMRAGDHTPREADDEKFGKLVADEQLQYLGRFERSIRDGELSDAQIRARAQMYANRLCGTANEVFVLASVTSATFEWMLGGSENHCDDCPELAEAGPYTESTLPTVPRAGETECRMNCLCWLQRTDGVEGFRPTP